MALQYTVWKGAANVAQGAVVNENVVSIEATAQSSPTVIDPNADARAIRYVRLSVPEDCFVTWGSNPTALNDGTEGRQMGGGTNGVSTAEYFWMEAGWSISAIQRS